MSKNNGVTIWTVQELVKHAIECATSKDGVNWVPARPLGWSDIPSRFKAAWMVWRGKADAVTWPAGQ